MLTRISNTASVNDMERMLSAKFDYEFLYSPKTVINGLKETSVALITANAPKRIQYGIWGILPDNYEDSWKPFQSSNNTLETNIKNIQDSNWLFDALLYRRCLIIATGFYTFNVKDHFMYPTYHSVKNQNIFCFAGIYNVLADGFITFTILSHSTVGSKDIIETPQPIIIKQNLYIQFLKKKFLFNQLINHELEINRDELISNPISKLVYKDKNYPINVPHLPYNQSYY
ncbi:SOS response-associated peptidase family protein [Aquimarina intermedia]|uniref:SOS response associated peptidase (SRAP) n=1 Tax=Aquimarina intermedia TaxID=350814 RepID=A0A5S5C9Q1_9FLAO|nr:SOS response-associated peptidase family protein [Aquimarina intermedia]TYP75096.1 SOS response associated peptidase (SRAP) [Aquimarina intermedia]